MNQLIGLMISFLFLFLILLTAMFLTKHHKLNDEESRKFIHILASNWWFIAMFYFESVLIATIIPLVFILINYFSYKYNLIKAIEREVNNHPGSIYYSISLFILVLVTFGLLENPVIGAIGIMIMGYADGLAALIGKRFGKKKIYHYKTVIGTLTMFIVSFIVSLSFLLIYHPRQFLINSLILSLIATILELFSLDGIDNLTVPLTTSFIYYLLFYI